MKLIDRKSIPDDNGQSACNVVPKHVRAYHFDQVSLKPEERQQYLRRPSQLEAGGV